MSQVARLGVPLIVAVQLRSKLLLNANTLLCWLANQANIGMGGQASGRCPASARGLRLSPGP